MSELSNRVNSLAESATIAMAQKARALKAEGKDIISLSLGEPDFKTPKHIQEAAKSAIDSEMYFAYPPVPGYLDFRTAIAEKLQSENNISCTADNIVVSGGAKHSLYNIFQALLNPKDEVIVFAPYWVSYVDMISLCEGTPVPISAGVDQEFKVTAEQLENAITDKTKAVIFSSPCNPSGAVWNKKELEALAAVFRKHPNVHVIADEIYEYINYTEEHHSLASFPGMIDQVITVNGLSKGYAMTGWRVGYICAPLAVAKACGKLQSQITSGTCSIAQRAALAAITGNQEDRKKMAEAYKRRRSLVKNLLDSIPNLVTPMPDGAFYFFPDVSAYFGKKTNDTIIKNANDLAMYLLSEFNVSTVTGAAFGAPNCLRLSYAASDENLVEALSRIKNALAQLA